MPIGVGFLVLYYTASYLIGYSDVSLEILQVVQVFLSDFYTLLKDSFSGSTCHRSGLHGK